MIDDSMGPARRAQAGRTLGRSIGALDSGAPGYAKIGQILSNSSITARPGRAAPRTKYRGQGLGLTKTWRPDPPGVGGPGAGAPRGRG